MDSTGNTMTAGSRWQDDIELLPGTKIMTDPGNLHSMHANKGRERGKGGRKLVRRA